MARRRDLTPPPAPPEELTDEQAAALERSVSAPGWRLDGPEFAGAQHAVTQLLADRWRRTPPGVQQERLADARRGIYWPGAIKKHAKPLDDPPRTAGTRA